MESLTSAVPYEWYIGVICRCSRKLTLFRDLNKGKAAVTGIYEITCPYCSESGSYLGQSFRRRVRFLAEKALTAGPE